MKEQVIKNKEVHLVNRINWLRAAVLGANDGILSIASIITGMIAGGASRENILLAGLAALVAGAVSMATGEYVSVTSQVDTEKADLEKEKQELADNPVAELEELAQIYISRGVEKDLAKKVAKQLMLHDALGAHARDELGISEVISVNPLQAALVSAASFTAGGILPFIVALIFPTAITLWAVVVSALISLGALGALSAKTGGVAMLRPAIRVLLWGSLSLFLTSTIGTLLKITI